MLQIQALRIQGFKSFRTEQAFDFKSKACPGFYFITGENQVDVELGANGVGKSNFSDSICFAFFGKTSSGLKASNVQNWAKTEPCRVSVEFSINSISYIIERTWSPNTLNLYKGLVQVAVTQEQIDELIGINYTTFCYSVLISQFSAKFFDLQPIEKLELFTDVLELNKWIIYSEKAKTLSKEYELDMRVLEKDQANKEGKLQILKQTNYQKELNQWELHRQDKLKNVENAYIGLQSYIEEVKTKILNNDRKMLVFNETLNSLNTDLTDSKQQVQAVKNELNELSLNLREVSNQKNVYLRNFNKIKNLQNSNCPTCNQMVSNTYMGSVEIEYSKLIQDLEEQEKTFNTSIAGVLKRIKDHTTVQDSIQGQIKTITSSNTQLQQENSKAKVNLEWSISQLNTLENEQHTLLKEANPFLNLESKLQHKLNLYTRMTEYLSQDHQILKSDLKVCNYWEKGFKEIRLMILEEVLQEFEVLININLKKLGMNSWKVKLEIQTETKSGGVRKGFIVKVSSPINTELVPFECWSGGEGQRLRLAGTMALMDLINNKSPNQWSIEFWDESSTWLSSRGVEDLLECLKTRSMSLNKQVFIIDHRDFNTYGGFTDTIKLIKTKKGSVIED